MTFSSKAFAACALLILLGIGMLSFRSMVRNEDDRGWVAHTHLVLERLQQVLTDVTQAESGQRGYILTGEEEYQGAYQAARDQVPRDIAEVRKLTADNPAQQMAIKGLELKINALLAVLTDRAEIRRRAGLIAGSKAVTNGHGEGLMNEVRERIGEMRHTEEVLLSSRSKAAAAGARQMKAVITLGSALAILISLLAGFVIHREAVRRSLAEKELQRANENLARRTVELSETNHGLESFSYSVAHDLRAPLRHIAGYSGLLEQEYGPKFDAEGRRCLAKIVDGAQKMGRLIDDLLSLSKIGLQELSLEVTSLNSLVRRVVGELDVESSGRKIEWQVGQLFDVRCDSGLVKQVFANLLSNAVKYTGKRERAVIQVGQMMQNNESVVFVRDNGVGFEMQYAGKLFGVFQRLHKATDFEGTGVGLAIVQRIIRKHGGKVWAEAEPDRGATFFFTLGSPPISPSAERKLTMREEAMHV